MKSQHGPTSTDELSLRDAKLIRLPAVTQRVGMQRTAVYGLIKEGKFPHPLKLGGASVWVDVEITRWMESLVAARDARA